LRFYGSKLKRKEKRGRRGWGGNEGLRYERKSMTKAEGGGRDEEGEFGGGRNTRRTRKTVMGKREGGK
jgi:hypothetical protein